MLDSFLSFSLYLGSMTLPTKIGTPPSSLSLTAKTKGRSTLRSTTSVKPLRRTSSMPGCKIFKYLKI